MIKQFIKRAVVYHWKTSVFGLVCLALGVVSMSHTYVETNTLCFNVVYVWPGAFALIAAGILGICAADHK